LRRWKGKIGWGKTQTWNEVPTLNDICEFSRKTLIQCADYRMLQPHTPLKMFQKIYKHSFVHLLEDLQNEPNIQDSMEK